MIPAHIEREARNDLQRRYSINWADVVALLMEPGFEVPPHSDGQEVHDAVYRAAMELLRREGLA